MLRGGRPAHGRKVRSHSLIHKRCGTSFIIFVLLVSIFVFSFFGRPPFLLRVLLHLALLPVVAGISYEIIRLAGREEPLGSSKSFPSRACGLSGSPRREPDDQQIEVAIRSLSVVLHRDSGASTDSPLAGPIDSGSAASVDFIEVCTAGVRWPMPWRDAYVYSHGKTGGHGEPI